MRFYLFITILYVNLVNGFDADQLKNNLFVQSYFSACNFCTLVKQIAQVRPSIEQMRSKAFHLCSLLPKHIFDNCDHLGSLALERINGYLSEFVTNTNSCNEYCEKKISLLDMERLCGVARNIYRTMDQYVEPLMSDMKKLCFTSTNPFTCIEQQNMKKPILEGIFKRSFMQVINMIDTADLCNIGNKQKKSVMDDVTTTTGTTPAPPPSKIVCELCYTLFRFLGKILTTDTPTGVAVTDEIAKAISQVCQQVFQQDVTSCDSLSKQIVQLTVFLPQLMTIACGQSMRCDMLSV